MVSLYSIRHRYPVSNSIQDVRAPVQTKNLSTKTTEVNKVAQKQISPTIVSYGISSSVYLYLNKGYQDFLVFKF